jgi:hypothetical protein
MQFGMAFRWVIASVDGSCSRFVEWNRQGQEERGQHLGRGSVTLRHSYLIGVTAEGIGSLVISPSIIRQIWRGLASFKASGRAACGNAW